MCKQELEQRLLNNKYIVRKMKELGILENYTGFYFIVDILDLLINQMVEVKSFSKDIYPKVAKIYNKDVTTIERNIRNLINHIWNKDLNSNLLQIWKEETKPSCCKFIYLIKNYVMMQIV